MHANEFRHRPIYGGAFGSGQFEMATMPCISNGLHAVRHMVVEPRAGRVLSVSLDKREALMTARRLIRAAERLSRSQAMPNCRPQEQVALWPDDELPEAQARRHVSKRRRTVYEDSGGICHYCRVPLELEGAWHVEHQMPRALGGTDDLSNLVASCVKCNLEKGDLTAIEYVFAKPQIGEAG